MSKISDLSAAHSLELLGRLRETSAAYAAREEAHLKDFAARRHALNRKQSGETMALETSWSGRIAEAAAYFDREEARVRGIHDTRRARIEKTQSRYLRTLPQRAKEAKGKWLGKLQMKELGAEREKAAKLAEIGKETTVFSARLERRRADFESLKNGARVYFSGYAAFARQFERELQAEGPKAEGTLEELHEDLKVKIQTADEQLAAFRQQFWPRFFRAIPPAIFFTFTVAGALVAAFAMGLSPQAWSIAMGAGTLVVGIWEVLYLSGRKKAQPAAAAVSATLAHVRRTLDAAAAAAEARDAGARQAVEEHHETEHKAVREKWAWASAVESQFEQVARDKVEAQGPRALKKNEEQARPKLQRIAAERETRLAKLRTEAEARKKELADTNAAAQQALADEEKAHWEALEQAWQRDTAGVAAEIAEFTEATQVPPWDSATVEGWQPSGAFARSARFAELRLAGAQAAPKKLAVSTTGLAAVPVALTFPGRGCLLLETHETCAAGPLDILNNLILRILASMPPGKVAFTIIDPVGLGQSFAGLMHLADYEEALINRRIWTQRDQIEERLAELNEHIEKVIQMYLRNEYATITQYNEQAGSVAEKYHFLVVADFPANFSDVAAKRLQSIVASGARCGVFTLIHWDQRQPLPDGFVPDELRKHSVVVRQERSNALVLAGQPAGSTLVFDPAPSDALSASLVHAIGQRSIDSNRVEVPFAQIAPKPDEFWTGDTTNELKVAIGRTGATKHQMLAIGKGTRQHALFAGKTGSGKSTLFHVIITNLALSCSPEQVEFYLIDFKKGVEFKCYATERLPHARVVAIESDREFALSVLQRVDEELKRRGDMFRKLGVQDIAGYKRAGGTEPVPRSLLIIDEFQEFFVEDDQIAQTASVLFDRIVRQGRAFGIHVLLGSQTLGGAYTLARATMGQMVIRVALQCNEADAHLIMDDNNSAPRLLSRPGEGIYNDAAGAVEGNSPFQVVWLSDEERDGWLAQISRLEEKRGHKHSGPIVFEGNAPAEVKENYLLAKLLDARPEKAPVSPRCWLGAPNAIKGPTEAVFHRQSGNHLLVVGQREEAITTMFGVSLVSFAAQHPVGTARFIVLLGANPGSADAEFLESVAATIPHGVQFVRPHEVADTMTALQTELQDRSGGDASAAPAVFVFIHGLHRFKKLKHDDDFEFSSGDSGPNPAAILGSLLSEGSSHGLHLIVSVDTYGNVGRFLSRKALGEFEMRVVFQMSANDSASLIDSPKAGNLGLHRALLYNEHEGTLETFRPYAMPGPEWIEQVKARL